MSEENEVIKNLDENKKVKKKKEKACAMFKSR